MKVKIIYEDLNIWLTLQAFFHIGIYHILKDPQEIKNYI